MTLTQHVKLPEIKSILEQLIPEYDPVLRAPIIVPPRKGNNAGRVGTAFDYAMRMVLERCESQRVPIGNDVGRDVRFAHRLH